MQSRKGRLALFSLFKKRNGPCQDVVSRSAPKGKISKPIDQPRGHQSHKSAAQDDFVLILARSGNGDGAGLPDLSVHGQHFPKVEGTMCPNMTLHAV